MEFEKCSNASLVTFVMIFIIGVAYIYSCVDGRDFTLKSVLFFLISSTIAASYKKLFQFFLGQTQLGHSLLTLFAFRGVVWNTGEVEC